MLKTLPLRGFVLFATGLNVFTILLIILVKVHLPPVVPLFYGVPIGEGELVSTLGLIISPAVSLALVTCNVFLSIRLNDVFLKKTLAVASFFVALLSTISVVKIILLVGFW